MTIQTYLKQKRKIPQIIKENLLYPTKLYDTKQEYYKNANNTTDIIQKLKIYEYQQ